MSGLSQRVWNTVVTNVPGPQFPLYAGGCRMVAAYPVVPLARNQAVSIGLTSYNGGVYYGLLGDRDAMPDVDVLADGDSTLALVINDRSRAPNLSAIRELALGVENVGPTDAGPGEIWVNDLRLDNAPDDNGVAALADLQVDLADGGGARELLAELVRLGDVQSFTPFVPDLENIFIRAVEEDRRDVA